MAQINPLPGGMPGDVKAEMIERMMAARIYHGAPRASMASLNAALQAMPPAEVARHYMAEAAALRNTGLVIQKGLPGGPGY